MNWLENWWYEFSGLKKKDMEIVQLIEDKEDLQFFYTNLQAEMTVLKDRLVSYNDLIYQLQKTDDGKARKIIEMQGQKDMDDLTIGDLKASMESLKVGLAIYGEIETPKPDYLNENLPTYSPVRTIPQPDTTNPLQSNFLSTFKVTNPTDMFVYFPCQVDVLKQKNWKSLPTKHKKLMALWTWMSDLSVRRYVSDVGDNWQVAADTYYRKLGDCEDSSTFFVTFARILGMLSNEVFLAVGPCSFGYHAFPIVKYLEEDVREAFGPSTDKKPGWYIFESTANWTPSNPAPLNGSKYCIDNGLMNWQHAGQIHPEYLSQFNGNPGAPGANPEEKKIENSKEKNIAIMEYWVNELKLGKLKEG